VDNCVIKSSYCVLTFCLFWNLVKLTKNYTDIFQQNIRTPETVADAVNRLLMAMEGEQKVVLAVMQEKDLINLRFSLGKGIRNAFRLHEPGSKLLASCKNAIYPKASYNVIHPDDTSGVIIRELWRVLQI